MTRKHLIILLLSGASVFSSCKKYLQVQPEGTYTEDQVFRNEMAAQQALNGLYIDMTDPNLYGKALTQTYLELMAQRFKTQFNGALYYEYYAQYQYNTQQLQTSFDNIWKKAYGTILSANVFLKNIDQAIAGRVMTAAKGDLLKGEALAVRAMLHFDLLRIFGPVYSIGSAEKAIPYYTGVEGTSQPLLSAADVLKKVLEDLAAAERLLENDPVRTAGVVAQMDFYAGYRNQRLNYYAVKALQARAYLWGGRKAEAHAAALAALNEGEKWFPWLHYTAIVNNADPDRIFSPELIFSLYNPDLYNNYLEYYGPLVMEGYILSADPTNLRNAFENNENDYRYTTTWRITLKTYRTFDKYMDVVNKRQPWRFLQPMIRKTELYYILAETDADPAKGLAYLNAVRDKRGLAALTSTAVLQTEIAKEYKKEFYGEGQLFFYYKRNDASDVIEAIWNYPMKPVYLVPLPLSETTPR